MVVPRGLRRNSPALGQTNGTAFAYFERRVLPIDDAPKPISHQRRTNGCQLMSPQPREESAEDGPYNTIRSAHVGDEPGDLDASARMMRHFSHRCRNSLNGIKLGMYVLKKELASVGTSASRWNELGRTYDEIEKLFDRLQRIYQSTPLTVVRSPLGQLIAERFPFWRTRFAASGRSILVNPPGTRPPVILIRPISVSASTHLLPGGPSRSIAICRV